MAGCIVGSCRSNQLNTVAMGSFNTLPTFVAAVAETVDVVEIFVVAVIFAAAGRPDWDQLGAGRQELAWEWKGGGEAGCMAW